MAWHLRSDLLQDWGKSCGAATGHTIGEGRDPCRGERKLLGKEGEGGEGMAREAFQRAECEGRRIVGCWRLFPGMCGLPDPPNG